MPNSKIPSPACSLGVISTPRKHRFRRSLSVGSQACSNTSTKLSYIQEGYGMAPFTFSPLRTRRSVLSDNTDIDIPGRQSWYKRLDDDNTEVVEVLERGEQVENVQENINAEILSQEKKNITIDLPESSDGESISSIVIPQRKLFSLKDNLQAQKLFNNIMENRENFALRKSKSYNDKTIIVGKKDLFNRSTKKRGKSIFSANMQNATEDSTVPNKAKEIENQGKARNLFGNQVANKRKNMFAEFIVSDSEDEIPDIQPKIFGFATSNEQQQPQTKKSRRSTIQRVQNTSVGSYISNDELDDWRLLPSSTMVENELSVTEEGTPVKRVRLSEKNKTRSLAEDTGTNEVNKNKQSIITANNALRSKFTNEQFIVSQHSYINESKTCKEMLNKSNKSLTINDKSRSLPNNEVSTHINNPTNELDAMNKQNLPNDKTTATLQNSDHDSNINLSTENFEINHVDDNDFTLQYENDGENLVDSTLEENNVTLQHIEDGKSGTSCMNNCTSNNTILKSNVYNNTIESNLIKLPSLSMNDKNEKDELVSKMQNKTLPHTDLNEDSKASNSFEVQNQDENINSSKVVAVEQEHLIATSIHETNLVNINEMSHSSLAVKVSNNNVKEPEILDNIEENNRKRNCSNHNLDNESMKNILNHSIQQIENINESKENDIDGNSTIQRNVELEINRNEIENNSKSNQESTYCNNNHDNDDKIDDNVMESEENQVNIVNIKNNVEENVDSYVNRSINHREDKVEEQNNEENNENDESIQKLTEPDRNEEDDEIIDTETDADNQEDDTENEEDNKSEDDNIGESHIIIEALQNEDNEMDSTEIEQDYSLENEKHKEDSKVYHESSAENLGDDYVDGDNNESYEKADKQNTSKGRRISHISNVSGQSAIALGDDVTVESNHDESRMKRRTALQVYLMNMKKANIEKKRQTEIAIRNSIKSGLLREANLFKVPAIPKAALRSQKSTAQTKPKVKHVSTFENLPPELLNDLQYKPPRRYQPRNVSWITKRLYKYLEDKLKPKYDYKARVRAEKLVETINMFTRELRRHSVASPDAVTRLKAEMAHLGVTKTHYDFYEFFHEFMPREIRVKVVPDIVNKISLPKHGIFSDILR